MAAGLDYLITPPPLSLPQHVLPGNDVDSTGRWEVTALNYLAFIIDQVLLSSTSTLTISQQCM